MAKRGPYRRRSSASVSRRVRAEEKRPTAEEKFMALARARFEQGSQADEKQRKRELEALKFAGGDQWPTEIRALRDKQPAGNGLPELPARPVVTINKTLEPLAHLLAEMEDANLGFELVPADDFADLVGELDETEIKTREGLVRRIQRDSQAIEARLWGADRGNQCGRGYWAVLTRYVPGKSFDQEVYVHKLYNQAAVTLDPNREHFDGSDANWGFIGHDLPWDEYVAEFGEVDTKRNRVLDMGDDEFRQLGEDYPGWFTTSGEDEDETRSCRVLDYFYVDFVPRELVKLQDGRVLWKDEITDTDKVIETRSEVERQVKWAKIDGIQRLDETDWPSPWLPIIEYQARPLQPYDDDKRTEGLVQPMMESGRGFNYMVSKFVETIGLSPLPSPMMAAGQDENFEQEYKLRNIRALPATHYNQMDVNGRPAPPPFMLQPTDSIQPLTAGLAMFNDLIQATTQSHAPTHGQTDPSIRSSKMYDTLIAQDKRGDSSVINNWARSIRHEGRIINSLLYPIYGIRPGRLASIIDGESQTPRVVMLNQPFVMQGRRPVAAPAPGPMMSPAAPPAMSAQPPMAPGAPTMPPAPPPVQPQAPTTEHFKLTKNANFNVVVKVTKGYETRRQQQAALLGELVAEAPDRTLPIIGDLFAKSLDSLPDHEAIAKRYRVMLAPPIQQMLESEASGLDVPPQIHALVTQQQQTIAQQAAFIKQQQEQIAAEQVKVQGEYARTQLAEQTKLEIARENNAAKIEEARIAAAKEAADAEREAQEEAIALRLTQAHEATQAALAREHERKMEEGRQAHEAALMSLRTAPKRIAFEKDAQGETIGAQVQ